MSKDFKWVDGVIHHHLRDAGNHPIGFIVARAEGNTLHLGWSKWHFDSSKPWLLYEEEMGYKKAIGRLNNRAPMPHRDFVLPAEDLQVIRDRAVKYFRLQEPVTVE